MLHPLFKRVKKKDFNFLRRQTLIISFSLLIAAISINTAFAYVSEPPGDDGIPPGSDNCPTVVNPEQRNNDQTPGAPTFIILSIALLGNPPTDYINGTPASMSRSDEDNGNYTSTNMELDCNPCVTATFPSGITGFGGGGSFCGYSSQVPEQMATNEDEFCGYDSTADEYWDFTFLTHNRWGTCIGDSTACTNAGDFSSYNRTIFTQDTDGNACDCATDGFCTAYQWCVDQATPDADCGAKVVPDDITDLAAANGETTLALTWSEPNDNLGPIYGYRVEYGTVASGLFASTCSDPSCTDGTTGATVSGLDNNVNYQFRVYALNDNGESGASNVVTGKVSHIRQWPTPGSPGNVEISSSTNRNYTARGIYTTDETFIATWIDDNGSLSNDKQLYAQKLDLSTGGAFGTGSWVSGGLEISESNGFDNPYSDYANTSDGAGGIITAWTGGSAWNLQDVYVQRLDSNGDWQWFDSTPCTHNVNCDNIKVSTAGSSYMQNVDILADGSGGAFVMWNDYYGSINVSRVDSSGTILWGPVTAPAFNYKTDVKIISDGNGGVILVFRGKVLSTDNYAIFIYKIQSDGTYGTPLNLTDNWPNSGSTIKVSDDTYGCNSHHVISDENGGLYNTCNSYSSPTQSIRAYHVDSDGFIDSGGNWNGSTGFTIYSGSGTYDSDITNDGSGGLIYAYTDGDTSVAYVDSLSSTATRPWGNPSPIFLYNNIYVNGGYGSSNGISADGSGGAYIAMYAGNNEKAILQHVDNTGTTSFPISGSTAGYEIGNETSGDVEDPFVIAGASSLILWGKDPGTSNYDIFAQYFKESTDPCLSLGSEEFCGSQTISSSTLTFQAIPETFYFDSITTGSNQDIFNNDQSGLLYPAPSASSPGSDILTILDDRASGGYTVDLDISGTFTDGSNTIPLTGLYVVTSVDETDPDTVGGITYSPTFTGDQSISTPIYVDTTTGVAECGNPPICLTETATYTGLAPNSQVSNAPLTLMNGTLSSALGRNGSMSLFANFYLNVGATQAAGTYSVVITYTLADSTT